MDIAVLDDQVLTRRDEGRIQFQFLEDVRLGMVTVKNDHNFPEPCRKGFHLLHRFLVDGTSGQISDARVLLESDPSVDVDGKDHPMLQDIA